MTELEEALVIMKNAQVAIWMAGHKLSILEQSETRDKYALALETVAIHLTDTLHGFHGVVQ
ncbi:hypothetical protein [Caballeronia sordidicola]|uniref:Uncharacterized protein n=1 Tax=Caballeronia sordidicola TaxID=196367 RepID=A0A242MST9_CABSO|nr:hypothetical protein [Caballeronia sordidicola]OTP74452.1 hypothetical protein PAMC26510_16560 [Caballeronia sordidicola]